VPSMALGWLATRSNGTKSRSRASGTMPSPVSVTLMRSRSPGTGSHARWTEPPSRLYLTALDRRFSSTCLSRWRSPRTWVVHETLGPTRTIWCWSARGRIRLTVSAATSARATGSRDSDSRPASMAAMSSTSLMRLSRCRAPDMMWPRLSRCSVSRSSRSSSWANPRMAFSGVRSSWLMRDRYSLLASLACSAASLARRRSSSSLACSVTSRETISRPSGAARARLCASRVSQCPSTWRTRTRTEALSRSPLSS